MSSTTFRYRYETGVQFHSGTLENWAEYFPRKWQAMEYTRERASRCFLARSGYVYDRCLDFTRWYDVTTKQWTRKQPLV